ncbi:complement component C1q receptor-like [Carassius auratus]|uniref:Complement component C1q receptor-like n=1 Tax=Carassius auratus TaxID=7957 RepID=A0A6P6M4Q5_CARAU|nr:complement component C1q receptor-like [Carassius auratus]
MGNRTVGKCCATYPFLFFGLLYFYWYKEVIGQSLQEQKSMCNAEGCYSIHLQHKNFLESWRSCKDKGGNLATIKGPEEASMIHDFLLPVIRSRSRPKIRLWIGLQRQPRKCSVKSPLRGFTWITGDQVTQYTNWQHDDLASECAAHRCVFITYNTPKKRGNNNNFKWVHRSCVVAVEGFLCRYTYHGMCPALQKEGGGPAVYTTPFELTSTVLTHIPIGSVATLPCPDGDKEDQSVMCMMREDGSVGWSKDAPLCTDTPMDWCKQDNGGCEHFCVNSDTHYYCKCYENYVLEEDGKTCKLLDPCYSANCEFECESTPQGHRCKCPEGYLLSGDNQSCLDIDECLLKPCPQQCVNAPGTFECRCHKGFLLSEFGECVDVDECLLKPCPQQCVNAPGTFECRCNKGFLLSEFGECVDVDECLLKPCPQQCVNAPGTFECRCHKGFLLSEFGECVDVDECLLKPCPQQCVNAPGTFECRCHKGFLLSEFGECVDVDECLQKPCQQQCINAPGTFECRCNKGFLLSEFGECVDVDECLLKPCPQQCVNAPGTFECRCHKGFLLSEFGECVDVDECLQKPCQQQCVNAPGTFECRCHKGFLLSEFGECVDVDECLQKPCQQQCVNAPGTFECRCNKGFLLSEFGECVDVDECLQKPCQQQCVNAPGTFECRCHKGFLLSEFGECVDVDECMEEKCVHICENLPGSYTCHCPDGFSPHKEDPEKCEDIDECKKEICEQVCRNYNGGFECLCKEGYMLQEDKYLCRPVNENKSQTDSPTVKWHPTYLSWSTEKTEEREVTTQTSNSPSSNFLMYTTTSAYSHQEDAPKEKISTGDKVDLRSLGNKRLPDVSDSVLPTPPTSQIPEDTNQPPDDKRWLILALLVILCVFAVVLLALGIVYCTSWAVETRSKSVTDCHRRTTTSKPKKSITAKSRA